MLLHTVNKSPASADALAACLRSALAGSHILLLEDGVYAARAGTEAAERLSGAKGIHCYALSADVTARGLEGLLDPAVELIDYAGFVRLACTCHAVQSWY